MKLTPLSELPEDQIEFNRARYREELSQGIFDVMQAEGVNRITLARLLGTSKANISNLLAGGGNNFKADTLADIFLVLGRAIHAVLGADLTEIRFANDEVKGSRVGVAEGAFERTYSLASGDICHGEEIKEQTGDGNGIQRVRFCRRKEGSAAGRGIFTARDGFGGSSRSPIGLGGQCESESPNGRSRSTVVLPFARRDR